MPVDINRAIYDYDRIIILSPVFSHEVVGYLYPTTLGPEDYRHREDEGILLVEKAGEILHRLPKPILVRAGIPLTDQDRQGWLETLAARITGTEAAGENLVLACSALKKNIATFLASTSTRYYRSTSKAILTCSRRASAARNHQFMNKDLLISPLATMEEPADGLRLDIGPGPEPPAAAIIAWLRQTERST